MSEGIPKGPPVGFNSKTHVFNYRSGKMFEKQSVVTRSSDGEYLEYTSLDGTEYRRERMRDKIWLITPEQYRRLEELVTNGWNKEIVLLDILGNPKVVGKDAVDTEPNAYGYITAGFPFSELHNVPEGIELDDFHTHDVVIGDSSPLKNVLNTKN